MLRGRLRDTTIPSTTFLCSDVGAIRLVSDHVCSRNSKNNNIVSWTSWIALALQHVIRKSVRGEDSSTICIMTMYIRLVD